MLQIKEKTAENKKSFGRFLMNNNNELIPCPWCGELPKLIVNDNKYPRMFAYYCDDGNDGSHYAETPWCNSEAEAKNVWNERKC